MFLDVCEAVLCCDCIASRLEIPNILFLDMFHKRQKDYAAGEPKSKRFRHNVADLMLSNQISGQRAQELCQDALASGSTGVEDLVKGADAPHAVAAGRNKNALRDMRRRLMKKSPWFDEYLAMVPAWNPGKQKEQLLKVPFLLPHELIHAFLDEDRELLLQTSGLCKQSQEHLEHMQRSFKAPAALACGLWIDGTPYNFDRSQTLECICLSFPGLGGANASLRLPLCAIPKHWCIKGKTLSKMLGIIAWSFIFLANAVWPSRRHDGTPWSPQDSKRRQKSLSAMAFPAFLVEVRGDWAMRKEVFNFPGWRDKKGCCHLCKCKPEEMRDFESHKAHERLPHYTLMGWILETEGSINELFKTPGLTSAQFLLDWLHIVDIGIASDFLGNLFYYMVHHKMEGNNLSEKVCALFKKIQEYYKAEGIESKLPTLTLLMIRKKATQSPKLRAKAAEARGLILFAHKVCETYMEDSCVLEHGIKMAATELWRCYGCLSKDTFQQAKLQAHARKFLLLCKGLENPEQKTWMIKPKHHSFLEMALQGSNPADSWTYRDEDFGGFLSHLAQVRGGSHNAHSIGMRVLTNFRAKALPRLKR